MTFLQFGFSAGAVRVLKASGLLQADDLILAKARQFAPAVLLFYTAVATNMRFLSKSTVDTFIIVRSVVPIFTQIGEIFFLGADWPNRDAWLALFTISFGALGFVYYNRAAMTDVGMLVWASIYLICITADMLSIQCKPLSHHKTSGLLSSA